MSERRKFWTFLADVLEGRSTNEPTEQEVARAADLEKLGVFLDGIPAFMTANLEETITKIKSNFNSDVHCKRVVDFMLPDLGSYRNMFQLLKDKHIIKGFHTYSNGSDMVDPSQFTVAEMASLSDKFNAIHDVAMAYNVEVSFGGFDNLPRHGTYANGSFQGGRGVVVSFNTMSIYPITSNPEFGADNSIKCAEFDKKLNSRFKHGL
tara:strand:- start:168515 stop:169135 length:621 start_codon:yes stop_codon:yes gene_type:complete